MNYSIQLPEESKTLIVKDAQGRFKGQATYWRRGGKWDLIGVTRSVRWLYDLPFEEVESELTERGLTFEWRKSNPFLIKNYSPKAR